MIKTVSLDTAKKLKEAGFLKLDAEKFWVRNGSVWKIVTEPHYLVCQNYQEVFAAPTSDEILEELPCSIEKERRIYWLKIKKDKEGFLVYYVDDYGGDEMDELAVFQEVILCESLAAMWLYLKQQGLLEAK